MEVHGSVLPEHVPVGEHVRRDEREPQGVPGARRQADHLAGLGRQRHPADRHGRLLRGPGEFMGGPKSTQEFATDVPVPGRVPLRPRLHEQLVRPRVSDGAVGRGPHGTDVDHRQRHGERHGADPAGLSVSVHPEVQRQRRPESASSFHPVLSPEADQYTNWYGNYLFTTKPLASTTAEHRAADRKA